jgi:prevent-host-death family protein
MRHNIISVTKAKTSLLQLIRSINSEGLAYILTKNGEPMGALVTMEDYESLIETNEILHDTKLMANLKEALKDENKKNFWKRNRAGKWERINKLVH